MKTCTKCGIEYELSEFSKNKKAKDGRASWCKKCSRISALNWKLKNQDKVKIYQKNLRAKIKKDRHQEEVEKRKNNKCRICGISLGLKKLNAKYCDVHKHQMELKKSREFYKKNIEKIRARQREIIRRDTKLISDRYIIQILTGKNGFDRELINNDIIETKRLIIKTKRLCKTLKS